MGCTSSVIVPENNKVQSGKQTQGSSNTFSIKQRRILRRTWKHLSNDLTGRGSRVFLQIFHLRPFLKELFAFREYDGEELLKNPNFKGHSSRFMQAVGAVIDNIDDPDTNLSPILLKLGRQHVHFVGFEVEYFEIFTEAMMIVWAEELGQGFTEEVSVTWKMVFDFIMDKLREGYHLANNELRSTENGSVEIGA